MESTGGWKTESGGPDERAMSHAVEHPGWHQLEKWLTGWKLVGVILSGIAVLFMAGWGFKAFIDQHVADPENVAQVKRVLLDSVAADQRSVLDSLTAHRSIWATLRADVDSVRLVVRAQESRDETILAKLDYLICRDRGETIEKCSIQVRGF